MALEDCQGKWRVLLDPDVKRYFEKRGLQKRLEEWRQELEATLNNDPGAVQRLLREPILQRIEGVNIRRYKLYLSGKAFRLLYILNAKKCILVFIAAENRDEKTYPKLRRRLHD